MMNIHIDLAGNVSGKRTSLLKVMGPKASALLVNSLRNGANVYGAAAGAALGSAVPIIGTAIGGIVGGLVGSLAAGSLASKASKAALDTFIKDDAEQMVSNIQDEFQKLAVDYLVSQKDGEHIADKLSKRLTGGTLKDMYASDDRNEYAYDLLEDAAYNREYILFFRMQGGFYVYDLIVYFILDDICFILVNKTQHL